MTAVCTQAGAVLFAIAENKDAHVTSEVPRSSVPSKWGTAPILFIANRCESWVEINEEELWETTGMEVLGDDRLKCEPVLERRIFAMTIKWYVRP